MTAEEVGLSSYDHSDFALRRLLQNASSERVQTHRLDRKPNRQPIFPIPSVAMAAAELFKDPERGEAISGIEDMCEGCRTFVGPNLAGSSPHTRTSADPHRPRTLNRRLKRNGTYSR